MTAATAPRAAKTQKDRAGRSRPRSTAITAVAAGSTPMTTAAWLAGAVVNAYEVSIGKPTTMPPATTASRPHWRAVGRRCRVTPRARTASAAATTARPEPMNSGDSPPMAMRVNGTVNEKARTPSRPHRAPAMRR